MKAYKIDTVKQEVYEVDVATYSEGNDNQLNAIYRLMECNMIEVGVRLPNGDFIYVDEEGRLREQTLGYFSLAGGEALCGHGLVFFAGPEGEDFSPVTPIEDIRRLVQFFPPSDIKLKPGKPEFIMLNKIQKQLDEIVPDETFMSNPKGSGKSGKDDSE